MKVGELFSAALCLAAVAGSCGAMTFTTDPLPAGGGDVPDITKQPTLFVVGYAHLDTQWRWTYVDSIRDYLPATLNDNFSLFEKFPAYVFNFSGSRRYKMMEEYYPQEFAKMKEYVAKGRWFPCGSSVDENDANVPSAESLVRQVLYGNKYFREQFGVASDEYMLPDCFGFPAALPSVLGHCGVKGFSTQKLTWGGVVPIPFKVGMWAGPDGHAIAAALDPGAYVGEVRENLANSRMWLDRINAHGKESGVLADYHYFGTGDTGGAPKEGSVAKVQESVDSKGPIKIISSPADTLFKTLTPEMKAKLPKYQGELMLTEHSAGSISSQAYMKRWNRKNELLADAAERASLLAWWTGARPYPSQKIEEAWYLILGSQMHDILPGTSLPKAYEYSWNDEVLAGNMLSAVLRDAAGAVIAGMDTTAKGQAVVVYNPLAVAREDVVEATVPGDASAKGVTVTGPDGKDVPAQIISAGPSGVKVAFAAKVGSVSFTAYDVKLSGEAAKSALRVSQTELENENLLVKLNADGDVASVYDKKAKRETLSGPARLGLFYENPANWPAWNQDWSDRQKPAKAYVGGPATAKVVENGPARVTLEVTREAEGSTFVQRISLAAGGSRVEFDAAIDWRTKERSLRASFPMAASNPDATFDIQTGTVVRPNSHAKQYEYSFHQWVDLTDAKGGAGGSIMSDSKYASDKPDDRTLRLTLLYTPGTRGGYPDQGWQDLGRHQIKYAFYPHSGDWKQARTFEEASRLNQPMSTFLSASHPGSLGRAYSLMTISDANVSATTAKKAEAGDEVIVRLREQAGGPAKGVQVAFGRPIVSAREVDGQERELRPATVKDGKLTADLTAFELRAFAVKLGEAPAKLGAVESAPVALAYDADVFASRAARTDGAMTDALGAYPAEQLPETLTSEAVAFKLGSTKDGAKNALACNGQTLAIPAGGYDTLYVLASAEHDTASTITVDGKSMPWGVQAWTGYVGQWDNRLWPGDTSDPNYRWNDAPTGLVPGYIKGDEVAWYASHRKTKGGDAYYQYVYIYKYAVALPAGAKSVTLPKDPSIKVFAASVAKAGASRVAEAAPLFDTLADHKQDAPVILGGAEVHNDTTDVTIEPRLYWRKDSLRYTTDGSEPTAKSPVYAGPVTVAKTTTFKAAVIDGSGKAGPVSTAKIEVNDVTAPKVTKVDAAFESKTVRVTFSEAVDASAADASHFTVEPKLAVSKAELSADRRSVALTLAEAPKSKTNYTLTVHGIKDASPAGNPLSQATSAFTVAGPVYTLATVAASDKGRVIKDVPGLPVKGTDPWTINVWVKTDKQPENRTIIAGFGKCEDSQDGIARYLAKFAGGVHFWSRVRDVTTRTPYVLNAWQMLTATYDGTTVRVYQDGKLVGERAVQLSDDENMIQILPKDPWEHARQFEGELKQFTVWGSALSEDAIKSLMAAAK